MTRSPLSAVLATVLAATVVPLLPTHLHTAAAAPGDDPLAVTLETMTPSAVPRRGRLTLTGEVTNRSDETWTDLQVYLVTSGSPMTTRQELTDAAATDPAAEVAQRLTAEGLFDEIGNLEPGASTTYTLSVPAGDLEVSGDPGVYWTGVHVLGAAGDGARDLVADGRARTFLPLLGSRSRRTDVALVVPFRAPVRRASDGRLIALERWQRSLSRDGRLGRLLDFVSESEGALTWLVDPAVLDAASSVARDNPPLSTSDDGTGPAQEDEEEPSESPSPSDPAPEDPDSTDETMVEPTVEAETAAAWLESFVGGAAGATLLAVPYGDVDVAAVTSNRLGRILRKGQVLSERTTESLGLNSTAVVAPVNGVLPSRSLARLNPQLPGVLSDTVFPDTDAPVVTRPDGSEVVLVDTTASSGGPGPNDPVEPLAIRQRVLAEAAVRSLAEAGDEPLVVSLPADFDPGPSWEGTDFFDGLDVSWLRQVDLARVLAADDGVPTQAPPVYPRAARSQHIPFANQLATMELRDIGRVFAHLLTRNDSVADELAKAAMLASSFHARSRPGAALGRARATTLRIRRTMQLVDVDGPPFVMMSSETGPIAVTVVNRLDEPVTVQLEARTPRDDLSITQADPVTLEPGQRAPVRMRAESGSIGVHEVTLVATTEQGERLGSEVQFNVRTSNVGFVIWVVMAVGGAVLLVMIVFRIVRRVRGRGAPSEPERESESEVPSEPSSAPSSESGSGR